MNVFKRAHIYPPSCKPQSGYAVLGPAARQCRGYRRATRNARRSGRTTQDDLCADLLCFIDANTARCERGGAVESASRALRAYTLHENATQNIDTACFHETIRRPRDSIVMLSLVNALQNYSQNQYYYKIVLYLIILITKYYTKILLLLNIFYVNSNLRLWLEVYMAFIIIFLISRVLF